MTTPFNPSKAHLGGVSVVLIGLIFLGALVFAVPNKTRQGFEPHIINKTQALEIISAKEGLQGQISTLELKLKNVSPRNIASYSLLIGNARNTRDYVFSENLLSPGETAIEIIPLDGLRLATTTSPTPEAEIIVAAVKFEGHGGDGNPKYVTMLEDSYSGFKDQARHILPLLRKGLDTSETNIEQALVDLEVQSSFLSTEGANSPVSADYKSGLRLAKQHLLLRVRKLKDKKNMVNDINQRAELMKLVAVYERLLARF